MITIWNIEKNKKITVRPCGEEVKSLLNDLAPSQVRGTSNTWGTDEPHFNQLTTALVEMINEGLVKEIQKGKYALTPAGRTYAKNRTFSSL